MALVSGAHGAGATGATDTKKKEEEEKRDIFDVLQDTHNNMVDIVDSMGAATGVTKDGDWDQYKVSSGSSASGASSSKKTTSTPSSGKSVNMWENLATGMKNTVTKLMDVTIAQKTAEIRGEDEKTIYEKIMSGDQTYIQYYDIKTGGLLTDVSSVLSYADSDEADFASADTYSVVKDVIARVNKNGAILGASTTQSLLEQLDKVLMQTSGFESERTSQMWQADADWLIDSYVQLHEKYENGETDAATIINYLQQVSDVVNSAQSAADYMQFMDADEGQAYFDEITQKQKLLTNIYNAFEINPLDDTQLQELLMQKEDIEREKSVYYNADGTMKEMSTGAKILDAIFDFDLQSKEEIHADLTAQAKSVNTAINKRLQELGFTNLDSKTLYDAYQNDTIAELAREHPVLASALTVASNLGSALQTGDTVSAVFDGTKSTNEAYVAQKTSAILRSTAAQEFSEWYHEHPTVVSDIADKVVTTLGGDEADAGEFVYNILMSAADDLARTGMVSVLTMGLGLSGKGADTLMKAFSTLLASSSAMSSQFVDEIENGASAGDALLSSFIGAVAEGASEVISWELLLKHGGKGVLSKIARTAIFEGTEEVNGQIFENILDLAFLQDESELSLRWDELKSEGLSDAKTFQTILVEEAKEAGLNFLSGFLSAGGTAIGTAPVTQAKTNAQNRAYGKAIIAAKAVPVLLEEAQTVPGVSAELRKTVSDQMNAEKPGKSYAKNVGQLYGEYSTAATQQAVQDRFVQLGFTNEQAQTAAEAIIKDMQGENLTKEQKTALKDDSVKQVHKELQEKTAGWYMQLNNRLGQMFVRQTADTVTVQAEEKAEHTEPVVFSADGVAVSPQGVTQIADGEQQIVVDKASGATMDVQDLQPTDERSAAVQAVLAGDSIGALGKDFLLSALQMDGDAESIEQWLAGYEEYYKAGLQGFNSVSAFEHAVGTDDIGAYLTADQKEMAITAGLSEHQYTDGVTWITSGNVHVSETQETEAKVLDAIGKEYGLAFVLTDNLDGVNGWYGKGTQSNRIVLSLDAEGGILTAAAGHEVFHYLKENAPDAADSLQKFVLQRLYSTKGFDINAELAKYSERYALEIDGMTESEQRQYLLEELTADSMFGVFSSKKAVELYARKQPKDAKKVAKAINNFLAKVRSALETLAFKGLGSVSALQQQYDTLDEISRRFFAALEEARINRQQNKNTAGSGGVEVRKSKAVEEEYAGYDKPIRSTDIQILRSIGRKHISDFTQEDLIKARKWATKYDVTHKIKSPFFRSWFGDWREYDNLTKLEIASIPKYTASNEARKQNRGNYINNDTGWDIAVSREGETNTISHSGKDRMSEYGLSGIKELIENAVLLDSEVHEHHTNNVPNEVIAFDHKLYALGRDKNGNIGLYKITVEEYYQSKSEPDNKKFHNLKYIKKIADDIGGRTFDENRSGGSTNDISTVFSVADLFYFVKNFDKEFSYNPAHPAMLNADGTPKHFYHGTGRGDRVGTSFLPERATSGPMAFFTDDAEIAANYARNKKDTSLAYEDIYDSYETQFRGKKGGQDSSLIDLWARLPFSVKNEITERVKHVTFDDDGEEIVFDASWQRGLGNIDIKLREHRNNALYALVEEWLLDGNLYLEENRFMDVLSISGIADILNELGYELYYADPDYREEKVYEVYLAIRNPFETKNLIPDFADNLEEWWENQAQEKYDKESNYADDWDKNSIDMETWIDRLRDNIAEGNTNVWTRIPDAVTDYLKYLGHDGVIDQGGKFTGDGHTVAIPFYSEQIKSVNENIGVFDRTSKDIRFSKKLSSDTADYVSRLQQENEDLQAALEAAKAELHETRGLTISDKELRKISDFFADTLQSDLTREDLFKALRGYFNYAADGGDLNVVLGTMTDLYMEAMQTSHSEMLWTELYDSQKEVLDDLRTNPVYLSEIQVQTVESNFDGYKNFQRASFGKIRFIKNHDGNHATLDTRWSELCDLSHGLLDPDTPDYAQPEALLDYYAATRPMWVDQGNPHGRTEQELADAAYSMAWSTLMDYMNAPKYQTFADKAAARVRRVEIAAEESEKEWQKKYDAFKEKHFKELAEQREKYEQRLSDLREHRDTKLDEQKEYYLHRIDTIREKRHESDERNSLRRSVRRGAKRLGELLINETDQKHIPENLKAQISTFLELFTADDTTFTDNRLLALQAAYNEYGKDEELGTMFDEDIANKIGEMREALHGKRLTALNNSELQTLKELTQHFAKIVRDGNKVFYLGRKQAREEVGQRAVAAYTGDKPAQRIRHSQWVETLLHTNMLTPNSFFEILEGPLAECYEQLLFHDQNRHGQYIRTGVEFLLAQMKEYNFSDWKDKKLTFVSADGDEINLTADEVCMLWATWKREHTSSQQARHLEEGGIVFKDELGRKGKRGIKDRLFEVRDGSAHRLSVQDMEIISEFMTDEMQAFTDELVGFLSKDASEWGNAVSMEKYGIKKFTEKYYIPFNTASNYNFRKFGTDIENGTNRLMNRSWTKHTVKGANTPIIVDNLTDVWSGHVAEMAQYSAFALTLDGMEQIFNYRTQVNGQVSRVSSLISTYYGQKYMDYFTTFMTDLNGKNYTDPRDSFLMNMISKHKKAAVMISMSVAVQQPTSYFRAMQELGITSLFVLPGTKKTYEEMLEYAPGVTIIKEVGGFDSLVGKSMAGYIAKEEYKGLDRIKGFFTDSEYRDDLFGLIPGKLDQITWQSIWKATKKQVGKQTGLVGEALLTETGKRFTKIINDTQVYGSVLAQSHVMRNKSPFAKLLTAFMAESTVNYNMLLRFGREAKNGNMKKAAAIGVALFASSVAQCVLKSLITASRDDDDEKTWIEKYLRDMVGEFVGNLPINWIVGLKDIISFVQGYSLDKDEFAVITDIIDAIGDLKNQNLSNEDKIQKIISALSTAVGLPIGNAWKDLEMLGHIVDKLMHGEDLESTATSIGYAIKEEFSFYSTSVLNALGISYDNSKEKYFERAFAALLDGDVQTYNDTLDYIRRKEGTTEKDIQNGIINQIATFSEDAFSAALAIMVGDDDGYNAGLNVLIDMGIDEEIAVEGIKRVRAIFSDSLKDAAQAEINGDIAPRDSVIAELADKYGNSTKITELYDEAFAAVENADPVATKKTLKYSTSDIANIVKAGNTEDAIAAARYLMDNGVSANSIKSAVTETMKPLYVTAFGNGDYIAQSDIIDALTSLDIGYEPDDFSRWEDDYHKTSGYWYDDVNTALHNGDIELALTAIDYIENTGRDRGTIKSQITSAFKSDYVAAVNSGNTEEALQIADALIATGLYDQKDLDRWLKN